MPILLHRIRSLVRELRRRKVVRSVVAYGVGAAALIGVAEPLTNALNLPPPTPDYIVIAALLGLPVVVLVSWLFELVPDTGAPTSDASAEPPSPAPVPAEKERAREPLPTPGTAFIGRRRELRELVELLRAPATRLVTVTGPGGIGKTRLALSAAQQVGGEFEHGAQYVALSSLPTAELLALALAESFGLTLSRRDDVLAEIVDYLRAKKLLLVLDNFDNLTSGAALIGTILEAAPGVRALVTSRERLNLLTETLLPLEGLQVAADAGGDSDAVQLFVSAARRQDRHFTLDETNRADVQRICQLVGGMPLAIELAAAWVRVLSCAEIHDDLARNFDILSSTSPDLPERHRSLRAAFSGSWSLLSPAEQRAVAFLAVVRSDFDRDTAQAVAGADVPLLRMLLDKSFLTRAGGQFLMLDVVRQYALEQLHQDAAAEREARQRHVRYFTQLLAGLETAATRWDPRAFARIAEDIDDMRAAWSHAIEVHDEPALARALNTLFHFYDARGWVAEGATVFSRAATSVAHDHAREGTAARALLHAKLTLRAGGMKMRLGQPGEAESLLREGLAAARDAGDADEVLFGLHKLAGNRLAMGDYDEAGPLLREALLLASEQANRHHIGWSLAHLGRFAWTQGDYDEATRLSTEALTLLREEGDRNGMWVTLNNLGVIAGTRDHHEEARRRFEEALALQKELGNQRSVATLLHNLGCAAVDARDYERARRHLEEGLEISERMGYQSMIAVSLTALSDALLHSGDIAAARGAVQRALRTAVETANYPTALEALLGVARLRLHDGDTAGAAAAAAVVLSHPASEQDSRERAERLLQQIGSTSAPPHVPDLHDMLQEVLAEHAPVSV